MFIKSKIQFFESKSQQIPIQKQTQISCLSSQRYNFLKANHNSKLVGIAEPKLFIKSKIQFFESKSQQPTNTLFNWASCLSSQRYNFLKANHNDWRTISSPTVVVYQVKDTIFWKQITTFETSCTVSHSCLSSQRYNFLKANHNNK